MLITSLFYQSDLERLAGANVTSLKGEQNLGPPAAELGPLAAEGPMEDDVISPLAGASSDGAIGAADPMEPGAADAPSMATEETILRPTAAPPSDVPTPETGTKAPTTAAPTKAAKDGALSISFGSVVAVAAVVSIAAFVL
jgi:hypothetical protein